MGRILGAVSWSEGTGADAILERMLGALAGAAAPELDCTKLRSGNAALSLLRDGQSFTGGISRLGGTNRSGGGDSWRNGGASRSGGNGQSHEGGSPDTAAGIIVYYGFMPGLGAVFEKNGLPPGGDIGEGLFRLYEMQGDEFLSAIPGLFTIALLDLATGRLLVAGDRSGLFPVYTFHDGSSFVFSTSIKAVKAIMPDVGFNKAAVFDHLLFDAVYGRNTYYGGVESLRNGCFVTVDVGGGAVGRGAYFTYEGLFDPAEYRRNRNIDAPAELTRRLKQSVAHITAGRDPGSFGIMCGGGIDCSYVAGIFKDSGFSLPVFCINVREAGYSEGDMAEDTAQRLGLVIYTGELVRSSYYPYLIKSILDLGQPVVHPNLPRFYAGAPVMLEQDRTDQVLGVASDLLFGGIGNVRLYHRYLRLGRLVSWLPGKARRVIAALASMPGAVDLGLRMRNELDSLAGIGVGNFERAAMQRRIAVALEGIENDDERKLKILMLENLCDYQQHLLNRRYEFSSVHGISLYFPFLDAELVRFAVNLPVSHCVDWRSAKKVVRRAAAPYLGASLAAREKWGGAVPLTEWVTPLAFLLGGGFVEEALHLDYREMKAVLESDPKLLWNLIDIELWGRLCLRGESPEELIAVINENGIECASFDSVLR
jgi:asparagine synthase (glutamine-hydrolysing)